MTQITWSKRVPIFKNSLILKQLGLGIGIPFGILIVIFFINEAYYGLILVGTLFALTFLFVMIFYRGTYDVTYELSDKKILCKNQEKQKKMVRKLSAVTFILGLLSGNLTAAGAGLLSGARTTEVIPWKRVRKVKYNDRHKIITIKGGFSENIALFCGEDNYGEVKHLVETYTENTMSNR